MKILFILFIIIFSTVQAYSQVLNGTYELKGYSGGEMEVYNFSGNTFRAYQYIHSNTINYKGYFLIQNDTLVLIYDKYKDPNPSEYEVLEKNVFTPPLGGMEVENKNASITVKVVDSEGESVAGATMVALDENDDTVFAVISDKEGVFPGFTIVKNKIEKLRISFVGFKPLQLELDSLFGASAKLLVKLAENKQVYNNEVKIEKYRLNELSKKQFVITSEEGRKIYVKKK